MPNTTNLALPYPAASAAPDIPGDIYNLANALDGSNFARTTIASNGTVDGQRAIIAGVEYRWSASAGAWRIYNWTAIPLTTYGAYSNGAQAGSDLIELNIASGIATFNFSINRPGGMNADTAYFTMKPGFRPAGIVHGGSLSFNGATRNLASHRMSIIGELVLTTNGGASLDTMAGTISYRVAN